MDIYISPHRKTTVTKKKLIQLKDIAEISGPSHIQRELEDVIVFKISKDIKANYIISIIEITKAILKEFPKATVSNMGEASVVLQFLPKEYHENKLWKFMKVLIVALTLFIGSSVTIMAYHEDVNLSGVFISIEEIFTGGRGSNSNWLTVPYSFGIGIGIIVFYNQFGSRKLTDDPTPIEIEMSKYDTDIDNCLVDTSNRSPMKGNRNDIN